MDATSRWTHSEDTGQPAHAQDESRRGHHRLSGCSRVCREAGAQVKFNAFLRDSGHPRWICRASRAPSWQLYFAECSQRLRGSPTRSCRGRCSVGASPPGQGGHVSEASDFQACRLVVVAIETGGRWSDEAADWLSTPSDLNPPRSLPKSWSTPSPPKKMSV